MTEIRIHEGESIENALRRFKRKVMHGRHYQGGQKALLLFEAWRKETDQANVSAETEP
jgi:ribosomal protein S21